MANLKRTKKPEWLKKRTNNLFFTKNHDIFTTPVSFAHIAAISRTDFETQTRCSLSLDLNSIRDALGPRPRPRRDFGV